MNLLIRSPGRLTQYYINDNWLFIFGLTLGLSVFGLIKLIKNKNKNSVKNDPIEVANPRGGDDIGTLAKIYEQCIEDDKLYIITNKKTAAIAKKFLKLKTGVSNQPVVISVGLFLYTIAQINSKQIIINAGKSQIIVNLTTQATVKMSTGFLTGLASGILTPAGVVGVVSLVLLATMMASQIDCDQFVTDVPHSQDEIHHVILPDQKQDRIYITGKDRVQICEHDDFDSYSNNINSGQVGSEETCKTPSPSPLYQRYMTRNRNTKKPLSARTKYLSDLPELDEVLDYKVEQAMIKKDKTNQQSYIKEKRINN